jgi:hypothetical protein
MTMNKEIIAALSRIEAIAHHYSRVAAHSDEMADAFKVIVGEAGEAIDLARKSDAPDLLEALQGAVDAADADQYEQCWYGAARAAIDLARKSDAPDLLASLIEYVDEFEADLTPYNPRYQRARAAIAQAK